MNTDEKKRRQKEFAEQKKLCDELQKKYDLLAANTPIPSKPSPGWPSPGLEMANMVLSNEEYALEEMRMSYFFETL